MSKSGSKQNKVPLGEKIDQWEELALGKLYTYRLFLFIGVVTLLTLMGRMSLWHFVSGDYREYLGPWLDTIRHLGGLRSIGTQIGDYSAPYHYLLAMMTYTPLGNHAIIKVTSTAADYVMAVGAALVCWRLTASKWKGALCYAIVLCLPTIFLNSAAWGQCDAMYTALLLYGIFFYLLDKKNAAMFLFGASLAVKLQAIFIFPAVIILWVCGRLRIRNILCAILGYFILFIPALVGAGNFSPLLRAYKMQASLLSLFANIYNGAALFSGINEKQLEMLGPVLIGCTVIAVGLLTLYCWQNKNKFDYKIDFIVLALSVCLLPFLLPAMKDRYYYLIEVFTVIYALVWPRRLALPLLMQLVSLPPYIYYLTGHPNGFDYWLVPLAGLVPVILFWDLWTHFKKIENRELNRI